LISAFAEIIFLELPLIFTHSYFQAVFSSLKEAYAPFRQTKFIHLIFLYYSARLTTRETYKISFSCLKTFVMLIFLRKKWNFGFYSSLDFLEA